MSWMNEPDIDFAIQRFAQSPVGRYARFLGEFRDEVNAHSDGWPYWRLPANAAAKLMDLLQKTSPYDSNPNLGEFRQALTPIKRFYTTHGYKAGMRLPEVR